MVPFLTVSWSVQSCVKMAGRAIGSEKQDFQQTVLIKAKFKCAAAACDFVLDHSGQVCAELHEKGREREGQ